MDKKKIMKRLYCLILFFIAVSFMELNANVSYSQDTENSIVEEAEIRAMCVLGQPVKNFPFYVYKEGNSAENNFFSTGNMGDFRTFQGDGYCAESPYEGLSCFKISYEKDEATSYGWAGLYWQYPPNNWGNVPKGYDLSGAKKLTFWARGKDGGEVINKFQVGGINGEYRDSGVTSIGPVTLSKEWKQYEIDLAKMNDSIIISNEVKDCWPFMQPLSRIIGGFCWATSMDANQNNGITFYLDEIRFEN